jgi:glucose-6-phosphate dehydrogenase assembly protein OpcA
MTLDPDLEKFSRGEPIAVDVGGIERELATLWKEAGRAGDGDRARALSRATLWNLVVPVRGQAHLDATKKVIDALTPTVPARVILLFETADGDGAGEEIRATLESNVVARPGGTRVVCAEEITLAGRGRGEAHFGALVRALLVPGLPTATLWLDAALPEALLVRELLPVSDRLVIDTGNCARPLQLADVQRIVQHAGPTSAAGAAVAVADLGWLRLANFRMLFAGLFDPPVGGAPLARAQRLIVRHRPGAEVSALLLACWLAVLLDWRPALPAAAITGPDGRLGYRFAPAGSGVGQVDVALVPSEGECGTSGIVGLELETGGGERYAILRTVRNHAELTLPIAPPKVVKLDSRSTAELCAAALGAAGRDPLLPRCLALATGMSAAVPAEAAAAR